MLRMLTTLAWLMKIKGKKWKQQQRRLSLPLRNLIGSQQWRFERGSLITFRNVLDIQTYSISGLTTKFVSFTWEPIGLLFFKYNFTRTARYVNQPDVRKRIHVGNHSFSLDSKVVYDHLKQDVMKSVKYTFPSLLDSYKVLLYQGQFDAQDGSPSLSFEFFFHEFFVIDPKEFKWMKLGFEQSIGVVFQDTSMPIATSGEFVIKLVVLEEGTETWIK